MDAHRIGALRVVIYTNDHPPPHVHVIRGKRKPEAEAKFNIARRGVSLIWNVGFTGREIGHVEDELKAPAVIKKLMRGWRRIHS